MKKIVHPFHYQIYQREGTRWFVREPGRVFYNPAGNTPVQLEQVEQQFGLSAEQVVIELFRLNGGCSGYYLANLRERKYYYCGKNWEDIQKTLISLGIGKVDPILD